jgi:SAM-dependent methyltransferase
MAVVLESELPRWKSLEIHESSPEGAFTNKLRTQAPGYSSSQFLPGIPRGEMVGDIRNEDLRALTFSGSSLDLLVTQDVLEHVPNPDSAFLEIARVLRPGGIHIFTVPVYAKPTRERARQRADGSIELLDTPEYHGNPVDPNGSLVITEWGPDLLDRIRSTSGMETRRFDFQDPGRGLRGEFLSVFVSRNHA